MAGETCVLMNAPSMGSMPSPSLRRIHSLAHLPSTSSDGRPSVEADLTATISALNVPIPGPASFKQAFTSACSCVDPAAAGQLPPPGSVALAPYPGCPSPNVATPSAAFPACKFSPLTSPAFTPFSPMTQKAGPAAGALSMGSYRVSHQPSSNLDPGSMGAGGSAYPSAAGLKMLGDDSSSGGPLAYLDSTDSMSVPSGLGPAPSGGCDVSGPFFTNIASARAHLLSQPSHSALFPHIHYTHDWNASRTVSTPGEGLFSPCDSLGASQGTDPTSALLRMLGASSIKDADDLPSPLSRGVHISGSGGLAPAGGSGGPRSGEFRFARTSGSSGGGAAGVPGGQQQPRSGTAAAVMDVVLEHQHEHEHEHEAQCGGSPTAWPSNVTLRGMMDTATFEIDARASEREGSPVHAVSFGDVQQEGAKQQHSCSLAGLTKPSARGLAPNPIAASAFADAGWALAGGPGLAAPTDIAARGSAPVAPSPRSRDGAPSSAGAGGGSGGGGLKREVRMVDAHDGDGVHIRRVRRVWSDLHRYSRLVNAGN